MTSNVEQIFTFIDRESTFMENQASATYLEGIVFALELWLEGKRVPEVTSPKRGNSKGNSACDFERDE